MNLIYAREELGGGLIADTDFSRFQFEAQVRLWRVRIENSIVRYEEARFLELLLLDMKEEFRYLGVETIASLIVILEFGEWPNSLLDLSCEHDNQIAFNELYSKGARKLNFGIFIEFLFPKYLLIKLFYSYEYDSKDIFQRCCELLCSLFQIDRSGRDEQQIHHMRDRTSMSTSFYSVCDSTNIGTGDDESRDVL